MVECTRCGAYLCETGDIERSLTFDFCPMNIRKDILSIVKKSYKDPLVRKMAATAAKVEAEGYMKWTRIEETMEFANKMGFKKLGIACCGGLKYEGTVLANILKSNGFIVSSVFCKTGSVPKDFIGLTDKEKVKPGSFEPMCNPIAQAELLNEEHTDLNIIVGLCVGHDSLFIKNSKVPVTCLIAKDRVLCHNPIAAIYASHSYYKQRLFKGHTINTT